MPQRHFIEILIEAQDRNYDFRSDERIQESVQTSKVGAKTIDQYRVVRTTPGRITSGTTSSRLQQYIADWNTLVANGSTPQDKLKIRFNAHGDAPGRQGHLSMADSNGNWEDVTGTDCARWLSFHGLRHSPSDSWALVVSLAACRAGPQTAVDVRDALVQVGVGGFRVTGSPHVVKLSDGHVRWKDQATSQYHHWSLTDGSKMSHLG